MQVTSTIPTQFTVVSKQENAILTLLNRIKMRGHGQVLILGNGISAFYNNKELFSSVLGEEWTIFVPNFTPTQDQIEKGIIQFSNLIQEDANSPCIGIFMGTPEFIRDHLFLPSKTGSYSASIYYLGLTFTPLTDMEIFKSTLSRAHIRAPWVECIFNTDDNKLRISEQKELEQVILAKTGIEEVLQRVIQSLQEEGAVAEAHSNTNRVRMVNVTPLPEQAKQPGGKTTRADKNWQLRTDQPSPSTPGSPPANKGVPTRMQLIDKWSSLFGKVGAPISIVICVLTVLIYRPSPGHFLPWNWSIGIFVGTVVFIGILYGLGALFGYLVWLVGYQGDKTSGVTYQPPQKKKAFRGSMGAKVILTLVVLCSISALFYWVMLNPPDLSAITTLFSRTALPLSTSTPMPSQSAPVSPSQQVETGSICWTYELSNFDGNRSQVWDTILDNNTKKLLKYNQFLADVVLHNPHLKDDNYVFYGSKTYLLPELCP